MKTDKVISALKINIATAKIFRKKLTNEVLKAEMTGMIKGYEFAIMLLENPEVALGHIKHSK